jgi:hypothetical protein
MEQRINKGPARVICATPFSDATHSGVVSNWLGLRPQPETWLSLHGSYLPEAHNRCFETALKWWSENPPPVRMRDRLLMLENDMVVHDHIVARARTHQADIVTGLYFSRRVPPLPIMWKAVSSGGRAVNLNHLDMAQLLEAPEGEHPIGACGTGIVSISRHVIEMMPKPWFEPSPEQLAEGLYGGHDLYFCAKAAAQGFTIAYDNSPLMYSEHVGSDRVGIRHYLAQMKAMEQEQQEEEPQKGPFGLDISKTSAWDTRTGKPVPS